MDSIISYLRIRPSVSRWLGGISWSDSQDVIEYKDVGTLAFSAEIALFLEGFASIRPLIPYGYVLNLLHLLGHGKVAPPLEAAPLRKAYREAGRPTRNAGALCGFLCRNTPSVPENIHVEELCQRLSNQAARPIFWSWLVTPFVKEIEEIPLDFAAFEREFLENLVKLSAEEIAHWLRHSCGSTGDGGRQIADEVNALKPRTLAAVVAALMQAPRLAGAAPYVAQLVSALALPPRRLAHEHLPTGGYTDVVTRGEPERILPSQFALDDMEFVRRFAANELLYFRREEPHAQTREELVILLDQGVRTWGMVRLLLGAAAMALVRLAARKKRSILLAATSSRGELLDPLCVQDTELTALVEASDLSADPGLALERILEDRSDAVRDVVLLTHPRNLVEPDVLAAARRAASNTRLFSVTADAQGRIRLCAVKHGSPVKLSQLQVELQRDSAETAPLQAVQRAVQRVGLTREPLPAWQGDIEPIGYPFQLGITDRIVGHLLDFDYAGDWLLAVGYNDMLHACKLDGSCAELLPRPMIKGRLLKKYHAVVGVAGGFVLTGELDHLLYAVYYDFSGRTSTTYKLGPTTPGYSWPVFYVRDNHAILAHKEEFCDGEMTGTSFAIDLTTRKVSKDVVSRSQMVGTWREDIMRTQFLNGRQTPGSVLDLDKETGMLRIQGVDGLWQPFSDGKPMLQGCGIASAMWRGKTLAATFFTYGNAAELVLRVFRGPEGTPIFEHHQKAQCDGYALSSDGKLLAVQSQRRPALVVRDLDRDGAVIYGTPSARMHNSLIPYKSAILGNSWLAIRIGTRTHYLRWDRNALEHACRHRTNHELDDVALSGFEKWLPLFAGKTVTNRELDDVALSGFLNLADAARETRIPGPAAYDPARWILGAKVHPQMAVDRFGQIAMFDKKNRLVCMFYLNHNQFAAWMPDGTRHGPPRLTGGPETAGALERIGAALRDAS